MSWNFFSFIQYSCPFFQIKLSNKQDFQTLFLNGFELSFGTSVIGRNWGASGGG